MDLPLGQGVIAGAGDPQPRAVRQGGPCRIPDARSWGEDRERRSSQPRPWGLATCYLELEPLLARGGGSALPDGLKDAPGATSPASDPEDDSGPDGGLRMGKGEGGGAKTRYQLLSSGESPVPKPVPKGDVKKIPQGTSCPSQTSAPQIRPCVEGGPARPSTLYHIPTERERVCTSGWCVLLHFLPPSIRGRFDHGPMDPWMGKQQQTDVARFRPCRRNTDTAALAPLPLHPGDRPSGIATFEPQTGQRPPLRVVCVCVCVCSSRVRVRPPSRRAWADRGRRIVAAPAG